MQEKEVVSAVQNNENEAPHGRKNPIRRSAGTEDA
jgi:hypothetical protein